MIMNPWHPKKVYGRIRLALWCFARDLVMLETSFEHEKWICNKYFSRVEWYRKHVHGHS
jgi:hypothetical protein